MAVKCMALTDLGALRVNGVQNCYWICDTTAELPVSGMREGDLVMDNQANVLYRAASATTLQAVVGSSSITTQMTSKAADETVSASTTLQDDNDLLVTVATNEVWAFGVTLFCSHTVSTGDFKVGWSVPTSATMQWDDVSRMGLAGNTIQIQTGTVTKTIATTTTTGGILVLRGKIISVGTAGIVHLRWAQNVATGVTTLQKGSTLIAARVSP